jgi:acetylornithine/succinyldiaminopimelate/putrescine aminotransferase
VIDEMQRIDAPVVARQQGRRIVEALRGVPGVADIRGRGLMLGVELADGLDAKAIAADLLGLGLIVNAVTPTTLRLVPPITVTDDEIDEAVAMIAASLAGAIGEGAP